MLNGLPPPGMDEFFLLLSLTMVPVLLAYAAYVVCCLFIPFTQPWRRVLPLAPVVLFGLYLLAGRFSDGILLPTLFLLATVEMLLVVVVVMFRSYGRAMRFLGFSAAALSLLLTLFVFGAAEHDFRRNGADSPLGLLHLIQRAPAEMGPAGTL